MKMNTSAQRHPTGLWFLCTTEMWERFAFYTMRAILVLYLVDVSTNEQTPGFGWSEAEAYELYGWYTGLVYLAPLLGGWIADKFLGQRYCVTFGAILMALGEFCLAATEFVRIGHGVKITMATDPVALITFYIGLGLMIFGNGFFKPCISVMVGQLYKPGDRKRDDAFTIFYMGINIGAFLSPLIGGTIAEKFGYHLGFIIAGLGMICGLISFTMFGKKYLKGIGAAPVKHDPHAVRTPEEQEHHEKAVHEQTRPLVRQDWDRIFVITVLSIFVIAFWVTFEQAGSSLNVFAKKNTNRNVANSVVEVSPNFVIKNLYLNNETVVEYQSVVKRLKALEDQAQKLTQHADEPIPQESFGERVRRLFSFRTAKDDRSIVEIYPELVQDATGLKERLQSSADTDIKEGLKTLQKLENNLGEHFVPKADAHTFPATWYQSVNALGIVIFAPIFILLIWAFLARRGIEPSTPTKFALGLLLVSISFLVMIPGAVEAKISGGKAAPYWLIFCYLFATWGELCLSPVGLSMVTKLAPARLASLFMGVWFMASSIAYILAGYMASYFGSGDGISFFFGEKSGLADFFLLMAIIPMVIGFIALALAPKLKKMMHGIG